MKKSRIFAVVSILFLIVLLQALSGCSNSTSSSNSNQSSNDTTVIFRQMINGRVLSQTTGQGIAGAGVNLSQSFPRYATTNADGGFTFVSVPIGKYFVNVTAQGYNSTSQAVQLDSGLN